MSDEEQNNNVQVNGEEQDGSPSKRNKNNSNEEEHKSAEEAQSENGNAPRVEPNLFTLVVHAILELDREDGARFDAIWKFIKSHFGLENDRRKLVRATVDESLEAGELIEDENKIRVNFAKKTQEDEAEQEEVPEDEPVADNKKRRTKRPAMKKGAQAADDEEDQPEEPETPRRGRKRAREASPGPSPKKRGRPAKRAKTEKTADVAETPRRRGRPAKNQAESHEVESDAVSAGAEEVVEEVPKRRGRPSKKGKSPKRGSSASPAKAKSSPRKTSPRKTSPRKASPNKKTPSKVKGTPSKKSPNKTRGTPSKGDLSLPKGWRVEEVVRQGGRTKGAADTYWYSPEGVKFRSRVAVLRHLEEQQ